MKVKDVFRLVRHSINLAELSSDIRAEDVVQVVRTLKKDELELEGWGGVNAERPQCFVGLYTNEEGAKEALKTLATLLTESELVEALKEILNGDTRVGIIEKFQIQSASTKDKETLVNMALTMRDIAFDKYTGELLSRFLCLDAGKLEEKMVKVREDLVFTRHTERGYSRDGERKSRIRQSQWWAVSEDSRDSEWTSDGPKFRSKGVVLDIVNMSDEQMAEAVSSLESLNLKDELTIRCLYRNFNSEDAGSQRLNYRADMNFLTGEGFQRRQSLFETFRDGIRSHKNIGLESGTRVLISGKKLRFGVPLSKSEFEGHASTLKLITISEEEEGFVLAEVASETTDEVLMALWQTFIDKGAEFFAYSLAKGV